MDVSSLTLAILVVLSRPSSSAVVVTTWNFVSAGEAAWAVLSRNNVTGDALDAVEAGCNNCEEQRCDGSVGWGSHPGENGETTLDAMLMDGNTFDVGAVGCLRRVRKAVSVARKVLENTHHSLLVGELATEFALQMGFAEESLTSPESAEHWRKWKEEDNCQPNFWTNVSPDPTKSCGPYTAAAASGKSHKPKFGKSDNHDTIGMVALDHMGRMVAGTSTNGAANKIPGRVGDSPIPGSGAYVDSSVGGAAATGDGDVMLRFLPSFVAVEAMRNGLPPQMAARSAVERIAAGYPAFSGAVVALSKDGSYGAACHGMAEFPFVVANEATGGPTIVTVQCTTTTPPPKKNM